MNWLQMYILNIMLLINSYKVNGQDMIYATNM